MGIFLFYGDGQIDEYTGIDLPDYVDLLRSPASRGLWVCTSAHWALTGHGDPLLVEVDLPLCISLNTAEQFNCSGSACVVRVKCSSHPVLKER